MGKRTVREKSAALRLALREGAVAGAWVTTGSPIVVELLASTGPGFIGLDLQHASIGSVGSDLHQCIRAADAWDLPVIVRVPWKSPEYTMQALDAGAAGIIVPMVNSGEEAREAGSWTRFPPHGVRSWGGTVRASLGDPDYRPQTANDSVLCFAMIETVDGLSNAQAIAEAEGIDGIYVGNSDLTIDGTGQLPSEAGEKSESLVAAVLDALPAKTVVGVPVGSVEEFRRRVVQGFTLLPLGFDMSLLLNGRQLFDEARAPWVTQG